MRILITRPREDAAALAEKLKARGHDILVEPMLEIRLVADAQVDLSRVQAVLFTSANGVRAFAAAATRRDLPAYCVGDTTAAMAREVGFARVESAAGNVDDLARLVRDRLTPADGVLLHAAGAAVAGDLAGALTQSGFEVRRTVLYAAEPVGALSPVTAAALKSRQIDMVVFFSARTAETFARVVREAGLAPALARTVALGLSPAVLTAVADLPWAMIEAARQPQEADLIRAIARHKIIAQLEGKPAEEAAPEVTSGRRADDKPEEIREDQRGDKREGKGDEKRDPKRAAAPPRGRLIAAIAWLAVLLALGTFALMLLQGERSTGNLGAAVTMRLETRLAALERQVANLPSGGPQADPQAEVRLKALADKVAALESRPPPPPPPPDADLARRVDALEQKAAQPPPPAVPEDLTARLTDLAARVAALESALEARPDIGQIAVALAENRRLAGEIARLQEQIADIGAGAARGAREGLLVAVGQLREAVRQGRPFTAELATVQALAADEPGLAAPLAALQPLAGRAVPTRDALRSRFAAVSVNAARAAQISALSTEAPPDNALGQWWNAVVRRLSSLVSVRRVGETTGETPAARLARAEQAVAAGDLAAALAALDGLDGPAGDAVAAWRTEARARVELDRAGEALLAAALAASGAASGASAGTGQ